MEKKDFGFIVEGTGEIEMNVNGTVCIRNIPLDKEYISTRDDKEEMILKPQFQEYYKKGKAVCIYRVEGVEFTFDGFCIVTDIKFDEDKKCYFYTIEDLECGLASTYSQDQIKILTEINKIDTYYMYQLNDGNIYKGIAYLIYKSVTENGTLIYTLADLFTGKIFDYIDEWQIRYLKEISIDKDTVLIDRISKKDN